MTVYPDGGVDPQHTSEPIYLSTCSDFISAEAAATIVAGSYRGISGTFRLTITLNEVEAGSCEPASPPAFRWQSIVLAGPGNVSRLGA